MVWEERLSNDAALLRSGKTKAPKVEEEEEIEVEEETVDTTGDGWSVKDFT